MTTATAATIRSVKAQVTVPVTYADVWEFWLRNRELYDAVDFVTIHVLPYWENFPVPANLAASYADAIRQRMASAFPGKEILIGETGWPSEGRMRELALPSRTNQARVVSEILDLARRENFRVNLFEAYDELWKQELEGTVGGYWGLFDSVRRTPKYPPGVPISNFPLWKLQMSSGMALAMLVFGAAWLTLHRGPWQPRLVSWFAVGISATTAGILFGVAAQKMFYESYGVGWLLWGALLVAATASPVFGANALMSGRAPPTILELLGPNDYRTASVLAIMHGLALIVAITRGIDDLSEADFDRTIATNLKSVFLCTQAVLPMMRAKKWGRIVNISSGAARGAGAIGPHYNASKAGVEGLTRGYAARLVKEGITVNAVAPSLIETEMMKGQESLVSRIPLGRFGKADEVARAVMMLVDNPYMTGQTVAMSGGMTFN